MAVSNMSLASGMITWYLENVLFAARSEIINRYGKENVNFRYDRGALEMVIKYSVVPFSWMMIATPSEKMEFAEKLHADVFGLQYRLIEIYEDMRGSFTSN